jgi:hypothetical protein
MRLFEVSELQVGSVKDASRTLGKLVIAELEPGAQFTVQSRAAARKRIEEAREFLDGRWQEIVRNYYKSRHQLGQGSDSPVDLRKLSNKVKPRRVSMRRGGARRTRRAGPTAAS